MRRLIIMRHAKSAWDDRSLSDHARPLNRRGRLAAALMGAWLREADAIPDRALISDAARANETFRRLGIETVKEDRGDLYHAGPADMLEAVRGAPAASLTLLMIGHQPGLRDFANRLLGAHAIHEMPTAQAVVIGCPETGWRRLVWGAGELLDKAAPKELV